jgi:hypothetical protein
MVITGLVFAVLLSGLEDTVFTIVPWDNIVLHYIIPVVMFVDWLLDKARPISFKQALIWIVPPLIYLAYSIIRRAIVDWYPYPFLNPNINGYTSVAITSLGGILLGTALIWLLSWLTRRNKKDS